MPVPTILIADDDREVVKLLAMSLKKAGYQVLAAADGCQAMDAACKHEPDLLILDVNMPAGSGLTVQQRLQYTAAMCTSPVIYLTGDKSPQIVENAKKLGAHCVLYKPLEMPQLLSAVRSALSEDPQPALGE